MKPPPEMTNVWQGTLALIVLRTLRAIGPQHGCGVALLATNDGTLQPVLRMLEQGGPIASGWEVSDRNRKTKFYRVTRAVRKQLEAESRNWRQTTKIIDGLFALEGGES